MQKFFAACPKGLENLLFDELSALNAGSVKQTVAGVSFSGSMETAMRVCLYSRFASRVFMTLNTFKCEDDTDLYMGANGIAYEKYFDPSETIKVSFSGMNDSVRNTQYGALRVKDAVCDRFVACGLPRPDVDRKDPDIHISCVMKKGEATVSLDLSGTAQLRREYSRTTGAAPLKENLAAAIVARSSYDGTQNLVDPMCGSATLLLEAVTLATDTAPGLLRTHYGFRNLKDFDAALWQRLLNEAEERSAKGKAAFKERGVRIVGFDADAKVLRYAAQNIEHAGFADFISLENRYLEDFVNPFVGSDLPAVAVTNPPYGERMGNFNELIELYTVLGSRLRSELAGGKAAVISSSAELLSCLRLSYDRMYRLYNGALECQLRVFSLNEEQRAEKEDAEEKAKARSHDESIAPDFANRLSKNMKHLGKWAKRENISAYRVYDADLPEYNAAIDRYNDCFVIQEYKAPASVKAHTARQRLLDMIAATVRVTGAKGSDVIVKSREKQKGDAQYEKSEEAYDSFIEVREGELKFKVNLTDYLDTGLFPDSRPLRRIIASMSAGKSVLNLFAYTCSASVAAAKAGASRTVSVDMSRTYLDWGVDNFRLNDIDPARHEFIQADCLAWLSADQGEKFDVIYIDPPTFSNSKRMEKSFDVQRDHRLMLGNLTRHLNDGGTVIFCTNRRGFKLDEGLESYGFSVENITAKSFDPDFARDKQLHTCFKLNFDASKQTLQPEALVSNTLQPKWSGKIRTGEDRFSFKGEVASKRHDRAGREDFFSEDRSSSGRGRSSYASGKGSFRSEDRAGSDFKRNDRKDRNDAGRDFKRSDRFDGGKDRRNSQKEGSRRSAPVRQVRVWGPQGQKDL